MQPYDEFTRATVFTHRPLRANEWFQVRVGVFIDCWSGSVQLGEKHGWGLEKKPSFLLHSQFFS